MTVYCQQETVDEKQNPCCVAMTVPLFGEKPGLSAGIMPVSAELHVCVFDPGFDNTSGGCCCCSTPTVIPGWSASHLSRSKRPLVKCVPPPSLSVYNMWHSAKASRLESHHVWILCDSGFSSQTVVLSLLWSRHLQNLNSVILFLNLNSEQRERHEEGGLSADLGKKTKTVRSLSLVSWIPPCLQSDCS